MKSLIIETGQYDWINRYVLLKNKDGYVLKIHQYKRGRSNKHYNNEIHVWGNKSVEKLRDFLKQEVVK